MKCLDNNHGRGCHVICHQSSNSILSATRGRPLGELDRQQCSVRSPFARMEQETVCGPSASPGCIAIVDLSLSLPSLSLFRCVDLCLWGPKFYTPYTPHRVNIRLLQCFWPRRVHSWTAILSFINDCTHTSLILPLPPSLIVFLHF